MCKVVENIARESVEEIDIDLSDLEEENRYTSPTKEYRIVRVPEEAIRPERRSKDGSTPCFIIER